MTKKQFVLGLMLMTPIYFMAQSAFAVSEPAEIFFLFAVTILAFLLSLFIYQMKNDIAKMQKTMDGLAAELKRTREVTGGQKEPLEFEEEIAREGVNKTLWDELDQAEKDEHIANIQKSMEYTGFTGSSEEHIRDRHGIIPIGT